MVVIGDGIGSGVRDEVRDGIGNGTRDGMTYAEAGVEGMTYAEAGVDTAEGARAVDVIRRMVKSTYRSEVVGDIGGFGGLFSIAAAKDMEDPLLVSSTDGVGTKLQIARLMGRNNTIGIDLVAMCVNDVLATGAEPLFFLDYIAVGKLEAEAVAAIVEGVAEGCRLSGCSLVGGEMAEHPGVMESDDYDLSGFCVGLVDRPQMLLPENAQAGDVLLGLASSGFHSNGYSLIRKVCEKSGFYEDLDVPRDDLDGVSLGEALLAPTRLYVNSVHELLRRQPDALRSLAHITGGGITENLDRALPKELDAQVALGSWNLPPVIELICKEAGLSEREALKTFNMGIGMVLTVAAEAVDAACELLTSMGESVFRIGSLVPGGGSVSYINEGTLLS